MFLYCIGNGFKTLIKPDEFEDKRQIVIRISPPLNNQKAGIRMIDDYELDNKDNIINST